MLFSVTSVGNAEDIITNDPFGAVMSCFNKKGWHWSVQLNLFKPMTFGDSGSAVGIRRGSPWLVLFQTWGEKSRLWVGSLLKCNYSHSSPFLPDLFLKISQGHLEGRLYRQFLFFHLGISFILQRRADRVPGTTLNRLCVIALRAESRLSFRDWLKLWGQLI